MMRIFAKYLLTISLLMVVLHSCRKEELETIRTPEEDVVTVNSAIFNLMQNTSSNDGSEDNILDKSNCFKVKLPVEVTANGETVMVNSENDYKVVEYIFDDEDDDTDILNMTYPVTIAMEDYSEVTVENESEMLNFSNSCNGENEYDDDIECIDFQYPISASIFNQRLEFIDKKTLNSDSTLNAFLRNMRADDIVAIAFPITVTIFDGTVLPINNLSQLQSTINTYKDSCDEDDDFDHNDDDCDDCNIEELTSILTDCSEWTVDKLTRDNNNHDDVYEGYKFSFYKNGRLRVYWSGNSVSGDWVASGNKNNITVTIDVPGLPLCNNDWRLHEISEYTKKRIDLRVDGVDRLRYNNICN
ncbi:hypothetical protein [Hyunsoonleella rubra]|uniref:Lipoprotein n=1 Tax=Hyunsoonleella rubra TaxID=1737062 RepID=A0ABW5TDG2_9FLAO